MNSWVPTSAAEARTPATAIATAARTTRSLVDRATRTGLPAGLVDAVLSSVATFLVGIFAARYLGGVGLGLYAVGFTAFALAAMATTQSFFIPAEVESLALPEIDRPGLLHRSLRRGLPHALVFGAAAALLLVAVPSDLANDHRVAIALTLGAASVLSPMQDHVRRVLHQGQRSWAAAGVSAVQLTVVVGVLGVGLATGTSPYALPFGALAAANAASLCVGLVAVRSTPWKGNDLHPLELFRSGRWLLVAGGATYGAAFVAAVLLSLLAGAVYAGRGEAVRVLSQPLFVISAGLGAVLGPRAMTAAQRVDHADALPHTRRYLTLLALSALVYALIVAVPWPWSPLDELFPAAYHDRGLLPLMIVAVTVAYSVNLHQAQLTAAGLEVTIAVVSVVAGLAQLAVVGSTLSLKTYSVVLGLLAAGVVRWVGLRVVLRRHYAGVPHEATAEKPEQ